MKCPICRKPVDLKDPEAPFCSERCRLIDLGNWASGKYVVSTPFYPQPETGASEHQDPKHQDNDD